MVLCAPKQRETSGTPLPAAQRVLRPCKSRSGASSGLGLSHLDGGFDQVIGKVAPVTFPPASGAVELWSCGAVETNRVELLVDSLLLCSPLSSSPPAGPLL